MLRGVAVLITYACEDKSTRRFGVLFYFFAWGRPIIPCCKGMEGGRAAQAPQASVASDASLGASVHCWACSALRH